MHITLLQSMHTVAKVLGIILSYTTEEVHLLRSIHLLLLHGSPFTRYFKKGLAPACVRDVE